MELKINTLNLKDISAHNILRSDFKYFQWLTNSSKKYKNTKKLKDFIDYSYKGYAFEAKNFIPEGQIVVLKGVNFQDDFSIDFNSVEYLPDEFYNNHKFKKFIVKQNEIIISLVGSIGKMALIKNNEKILLNQNNIALKLKKEFNPLVYTYILSIIIKEMVEDLYKVSGYSFLRVEDLMALDIPLLDENEQNYLLNLIQKHESSILDIKKSCKNIKDLINEVFAKEFSIDLQSLEKLESEKYSTTNLHSLSFNNSNLRTSYRWNKVVLLQEKIFSNCDCVEKLGKYILGTQNGWSPICDENATNNIILGIDSINLSTCMTFNALKYSDETKENIDNYFIKDGDLFVSRGNTPDLVSLASIANLPDKNNNYIFSDLMIRVNLNNDINKEYLAYIINSIIGRSYFKYVSKGKNQSMVKISRKELNDFLLPVPNKAKQKELVNLIKSEIDKVSIAKQQILNKIIEIKNIIKGEIVDI